MRVPLEHGLILNARFPKAFAMKSSHQGFDGLALFAPPPLGGAARFDMAGEMNGQGLLAGRRGGNAVNLFTRTWPLKNMSDMFLTGHTQRSKHGSQVVAVLLHGQTHTVLFQNSCTVVGTGATRVHFLQTLASIAV